MTANEFIEGKVKERDRFELDLSDAFDVKASFVLLILTFLGTISATILTADKLTNRPKVAQIPVVVCVVISGILCVACLWPKDYLLDDLPETYSDWLASQSEDLTSVANLSLELANGRIRHNHDLNKTKTWYLNGAFWSMTAGLFVDLCTLIYIALT
jgi:hypothetical protein